MSLPGDPEGFRPLRMSEWDTPRTVAAVKRLRAPHCSCDPFVRFVVNGELDLLLIHDANCEAEELLRRMVDHATRNLSGITETLVDIEAFLARGNTDG